MADVVATNIGIFVQNVLDIPLEPYYTVATMYVDVSTVKGKKRSYTRYLLRESYREGGKVKHRTIANLSRCSPEEIDAIRLALRHKKDLACLVGVSEAVSLRQGLSVGAVWVVYEVARQLGVADALGSSRQGRLALWQVIARVIDQGSRLSAVRLAGRHAACDVLGLGAFTEDDLYANLDWLCENQALIEDRLFEKLHAERKPDLFLYDVTSTYLEGVCNELSAFGYNRDGKRGKRQIVIGLLCNERGVALSIEVFVGNTQDTQTIASQVRKAGRRFGCEQVTFVGDRGMIKGPQIKDLGAHGFHYITAITKPQIESLLSGGVIQMELFDQDLAEVTVEDGTRYVLRRNPMRADQVQASREDKLASVRREVTKQNAYLAEHAKAYVEVALRKVRQHCKKLKLSSWLSASASARQITLTIDEEALSEAAKLDGCYVLKTDLSRDVAGKQVIHDRYKDLALVEQAFRTSKTVELEIRPVHVRLATRTRGHTLVIMLAYRITQELAKRWRRLDLTVQEGIDELSGLCVTEVLIDGQTRCAKIPEPSPSVQKLLDAAEIRLPAALPCSGVRVATRKKLAAQRKTR